MKPGNMVATEERTVAFHNSSCSPGNVKIYLPFEKCQGLTLYVMNLHFSICESTAISL